MKLKITLLALVFTSFFYGQTTDFVTGLNGPQGMVFNGDDLYIAVPLSNKISKINITATTPTAVDVVTGLNRPRQLLLNGNDLYIAESSANKIFKIDITDATPTATDVITGLSHPQGMVLNGDDLYIAEAEGNRISKINITDATPTAVDVVTGINTPIQLALNGNDLYIAELFGNKISKINITDATPIAVAVVTAARPNYIHLVGNELFMVEESADKISKINITDTTPTKTDVVTGLNLPAGMAIKDNTMYISELVLDKIVSTTNFTLSVNENLVAEGIRIFPNPTFNTVNIETPHTIRSLKLTNISGQVIFETKTALNKMDLTAYNAGIYFISIETDKGVSTKKIIKQ